MIQDLIESALLGESKKLTKSRMKEYIRFALKDSGYGSSAHTKDAIVYKDMNDYKSNVSNMWGGISGDIQPLRGVMGVIKPSAVVDVFIYKKGPWGPDLVDNVVIEMPEDGEATVGHIGRNSNDHTYGPVEEPI